MSRALRGRPPTSQSQSHRRQEPYVDTTGAVRHSNKVFTISDQRP